MNQPTKILLQPIVPATADDSHIGRFSLLVAHLCALKDRAGQPLYLMTTHNQTL